MNSWRFRMHSAVLTLVALTTFFAASASAQGDAASLYKAKCALCHAADGSGNTAVGKKLGARDFASPEVSKETDEQLVEITAKGKNKMPGYEKSLKDAEIKGLVAFIRELGKKK
ncbi:MAG: cytochrome c [Candidatus Acidiferrum sp.]